MKTDTWVEEMFKQCEKEEEKKETPEVKLSESDMDKLADIMIKKMSETDFDVESKKKEEEETENPVKPNEDGETPLD